MIQDETPPMIATTVCGWCGEPVLTLQGIKAGHIGQGLPCEDLEPCPGAWEPVGALDGARLDWWPRGKRYGHQHRHGDEQPCPACDGGTHA